MKLTIQLIDARWWRVLVVSRKRSYLLWPLGWFFGYGIHIRNGEVRFAIFLCGTVFPLWRIER